MGTSKTKRPTSPRQATSRSPATPVTGSAQRRTRPTNHTFPVAMVGASAGGLEAFTQLLKQVPDDTGMAFVFIQHLDPQHASQLPELLARVTVMPVVEAASGQRLEPNRVYVIPSKAHLTCSGGVLHLVQREQTGQPFHPIDEFGEALARDRGHLAIGVILSGTGTDGTLGLKLIKAEGGITFCQDEESAKFNGMPHSAIASGVVDFILPPEAIGRRLAHLHEHPYVNGSDLALPSAPSQPSDDEAVRQIIALLRTKTGIDFAAYKQTTVGRRIQRRMMLTGAASLRAYADHLQNHPSEVANLYEDIFIHVTRFFRDGDIYETLKHKVFPKLVQKRTGDGPIRIWVPGCSTGEEAYSLAMTWLEFAEGLAEPIPLQLFGTDISAAAIDKARAGRYPEGIAADVSPDRLRRFFVQTSGGYQIAKSVRDQCIFAPHNLLSDPPFTQLDLLCCRNVLIYLEAEFQHKLLQLYHYALRSTGCLVLGLSEDIGKLSDLFSVVDKKHRVYAKKPTSRPPFYELIPTRSQYGRFRVEQTPGDAPETEPTSPQEVWVAADQVALAQYAPASVIVNDDLDILQFRGHVGAFLEPSPGAPSRNLAKMAREGLQAALPGLVRRAQKTNAPAKQSDLRVRSDGPTRRVTVEVTPFLVSRRSNDRYFLVAFTEAPDAEAKTTRPAKRALGKPSSAARRLAFLERELTDTQENLRAVMYERDANNEQLTAALEEVQSGNEELQSTNEELQTAKEELQSANEELTTLNDELENRNQELGLALGNLTNVVDSVRVPILIVGGNLRIRLYNPAAEQILSIVGTDLGRPISEVKTRLDIAELEPAIRQVMQTLQPYEQEVLASDGTWYAMRIRPYQSLENKIDGAVLTWSDISLLKASLATMTDARDYLAAIVGTAREPLLVLDSDLRVQTANQAYYDVFQVTPDEIEHRLVYELGYGQWNVPELRPLLADILLHRTEFRGLEVDYDFPVIGRRTMLLNARRVQPEQSQGALILLAIEDVSAVKQLTEMEQLRQLSGRLQAVREEERTSLSREIHDVLGGALTGLKMQVHHLRAGLTEAETPQREVTERMSAEIDQLVQFVRQVASDLRPALLDDFGLVAAMEWQLTEFGKQSSVAVNFRSTVENIELTSEALSATFRIFQEALTNVARHAQASHVDVTLEEYDGQLQLRLHDNGRGVLPASLSGKGSLGLMGMRERAHQVGGRLDIHGRPGQGTTLQLLIPLMRSQIVE